MEKRPGKIIVVLYSHPELYPPTLNAVGSLADHYEEVHLLYKRHKKDEWKWPDNVVLHPTGEMISSREFMQVRFGRRMKAHCRFLLTFLSLLVTLRPAILLLYDPYAALFYRMVRPFSFFVKPFLWYHSHDVIESADIKGGNRMSKILSDAEKWLLPRVDLFSLPAEERKVYFDLQRLRGRYATLPNFPSKKVFNGRPQRAPEQRVSVGFQGSICAGRGLEDFISFLPMNVQQRDVVFSITGFSNDAAFRGQLSGSIEEQDRKGSVILNGAVPYGRLKETLATIQIGWVYYGSGSSMDHSMGTASNKFFECCAMGLPVLYNGQNAFEIYKRFEWAVPVRLTKDSISEAISYIVENYTRLSELAYDQFTRELNFETAFAEVLKILPGVRQ